MTISQRTHFDTCETSKLKTRDSNSPQELSRHHFHTYPHQTANVRRIGTVLESFPDEVTSSVVSVEFEANRATKYCAQSDIELQEIVVDPLDSKQQVTEETVTRSGRQRCANCCRQFIAFLFSTVGSCCLLVGYVVLGGLVFRGLEAAHERQTKTDMRIMRMDHVRWLWNLTETMNVLHPDMWRKEASHVLDSYTKHVSWHH